ncbi:Putative preQ0 transporter [Methanosarcina horonobensis HB-1 = JCM 15518]|uniref:Probable queuosine precursor transporter n=1 Tax=Methanosarcina horonobensis HB-1 = JCM 15518 TaxID=1434110 RepID=A0A0E3SDF6_9EURY|nr:queuosine precursor transporter [Methanosarcina horonobensis]AKB77468.1 Putative preQ0 transporter [Methanosarcina horonobensis HB-1 = JCM 15518]
MLVWIYWIVTLTIATYASVYVIKKMPENGFTVLTAFYVVYLVASQVLATRIIVFDLGFYSFFAPAAVFIYPFIAQVVDMINEVYGEKRTHISILIAFATQVLFVLFIGMVAGLTPAPFFELEDAWKSLFGLSIRITIASWVSFLICSNLDAWIFASLKKHFSQREENFKHDTLINPYIWLRSGASDIVNLTLDSLIFVFIAFYGVMPVLPLVIGQLISKNIIGFLDNPWFVFYKKLLTK